MKLVNLADNNAAVDSILVTDSILKGGIFAMTAMILKIHSEII